MLIKVLLPNEEEGLFNGSCQVAALLDAVKKKHDISRDEVIDLCTLDGNVLNLTRHLSDDGRPLLELYECYLVVRVHDPVTFHLPRYTPLLEEYASNQEFVATLNHKTETARSTRGRFRNQPHSHTSLDLPQKTHSCDKGKPKKRRLSTAKH